MTDRYTYRITWSAEDGEHVGLCAEFPSLSWLAPTPGEALSGIRRLVSECVSDMRTNGEPVPEPMADRIYSGKFMVRVPPETHRALAIRATEQGVSMNRLVSARLAKEVSRRGVQAVAATAESADRFGLPLYPSADRLALDQWHRKYHNYCHDNYHRQSRPPRRTQSGS